MAVRIDKSKNLDRALKSHLQELENFYFGDKSKEKPELSETEVKYLNSTFAADADLPTRPGRPLAHRTRNERTFQSFQAFAFVTGEMRTFRIGHGKVPKTVQDAFIEFALRRFPLAWKKTVREHIRKDQHLLPQEAEPTCYEVVRHEYNDGTVANVVVAMPANKRIEQ